MVIAGRFDISDIAIDLASFIDGFSDNVTFLKEKALRVEKTEKSAAYVAKSIIQCECHESCLPFDAKVDGVFVALGGEYAVGLLKGLKVEGYLAYILKKALTRFYRLGLEIKVNVGYKKRA